MKRIMLRTEANIAHNVTSADVAESCQSVDSLREDFEIINSNCSDAVHHLIELSNIGFETTKDTIFFSRLESFLHRLRLLSFSSS